jgi:cephalosporin hydroxylase
MRTLQEIAECNDTDKHTAHSYIPIYEQWLGPLRSQPIRLLEIGVDTGGSLLMWAEYFEAGQIFGIDVNLSRYQQQHDRITVIECNQIDIVKLEALFPANSLNIVIDDGSHQPEHQSISYLCLRNSLVENGFYFIEDIQTHHQAYIIESWQRVPKTIVYTPYKNGRTDDVMIVLRK